MIKKDFDREGLNADLSMVANDLFELLKVMEVRPGWDCVSDPELAKRKQVWVRHEEGFHKVDCTKLDWYEKRSGFVYIYGEDGRLLQMTEYDRDKVQGLQYVTFGDGRHVVETNYCGIDTTHWIFNRQWQLLFGRYISGVCNGLCAEEVRIVPDEPLDVPLGAKLCKFTEI